MLMNPSFSLMQTCTSFSVDHHNAILLLASVSEHGNQHSLHLAQK